MDAIIQDIFARFPYLSGDVLGSVRADHPQAVFADFNRVDEAVAQRYARELQGRADAWAATSEPTSELTAALGGLRQMVKAVSATSLMLRDGNALIVERPGYEIDKKRRGEISELLNRADAGWSTLAPSERRVLAQLALLGLAPLQLELVNYLDVAAVPNVMARMVSRLEGVIARAPENLLPGIVGR